MGGKGTVGIGSDMIEGAKRSLGCERSKPSYSGLAAERGPTSSLQCKVHDLSQSLLLACSQSQLPPSQRLIGANRVCYAHEYSTVDPKRRLMEMRSSNLTFCNFVSMNEVMSYRPHPEEPNSKTLLRQETVVTVRGVPLTSYMEAIILGTVSANAGKGRTAIEWVTERLENETKNLSERLEGIKLEVAELTHKVEDTLISAAKHSIEELQTDLMKIHPPIVKAEETENISSAGNSR